MIPTTGHDAGQSPLYSGLGGALIAVLINGHRWAMTLPGDPIADVVMEAALTSERAPGSNRPPR